MSSESDAAFLARAYGFSESDLGLTVITEAENLTYKAETGEATFAVRRYRRGHRSHEEVLAELSWLNALRGRVPVPRVLPTRYGDLLAVQDRDDERVLFAAFEYIPGHRLDMPTAHEWTRLGRLMRLLHDSADAVLESSAREWAGRQRPSYDPDELVQGSSGRLLTAPFLPDDRKERCRLLAADLSRSLGQAGEALYMSRFVHGDLHFGNILATDHGWVCLDFDECGFGPRAFDFGVVRYHARAHRTLTWAWSAFTDGYGAVDEMEGRLGGALRLMYAAGKLPDRLDIPSIGVDPVAKIDAHLAMLEDELS
jgi:Ser/Thr protein kinase RdoA (MazF antagonist)